MSEFFDKLIQRASLRPRTIVLPEGCDDRTLDAAAEILELGFAKLILLGEIDSIQQGLSQRGADPATLQIINPKIEIIIWVILIGIIRLVAMIVALKSNIKKYCFLLYINTI